MKDKDICPLFRQCFNFVLDVLCYAYYCRSDNFVNDHTYDDLEKFYMKFTGTERFYNTSNEDEKTYSRVVKFVYEHMLKIRQVVAYEKEHPEVLIPEEVPGKQTELL